MMKTKFIAVLLWLIGYIAFGLVSYEVYYTQIQKAHIMYRVFFVLVNILIQSYWLVGLKRIFIPKFKK
jgi:hypothetical protein